MYSQWKIATWPTSAAINIHTPFHFFIFTLVSTCFLCLFFENCFAGCWNLPDFKCRCLFYFPVSVANSGKPLSFFFALSLSSCFCYLHGFLFRNAYFRLLFPLLFCLCEVWSWLCYLYLVFRLLNVFGFGFCVDFWVLGRKASIVFLSFLGVYVCMYRWGLGFDLWYWFEFSVKVFVAFGFFRRFELNLGRIIMSGLGSFRTWLF